MPVVPDLPSRTDEAASAEVKRSMSSAQLQKVRELPAYLPHPCQSCMVLARYMLCSLNSTVFKTQHQFLQSPKQGIQAYLQQSL